MLLLPAYAQVITQDIAQTFSDVYKSDNGFRPRLQDWSREAMEVWLYTRPDWHEDDDYVNDYLWELQADYEYGVDDDWLIEEYYVALAPFTVEGWEQ